MKTAWMFDKFIVSEQTVYLVQWWQMLSQQQEDLWKYAIDIYQVIQGESCVKVTTRLSKSYEYFAKIVPNLYISRARFLLCVRQALASESSIACYDHKINWWTFFLLMFTLDNPKWSFKEILMRALYLLLSDSSLCSSRVECIGRIKLSWLCDAIEPFIKVAPDTYIMVQFIFLLTALLSSCACNRSAWHLLLPFIS